MLSGMSIVGKNVVNPVANVMLATLLVLIQLPIVAIIILQQINLLKMEIVLLMQSRQLMTFLNILVQVIIVSEKSIHVRI